jgi:hypothetical protein
MNLYPDIMKRNGWKMSCMYVYCIENRDGHLYVGIGDPLEYGIK